MDECIKKMWNSHTHTQWNVTCHKKEWNLGICDNMDGSWGQYAEWNKLDRERKIPYNFIYT